MTELNEVRAAFVLSAFDCDPAEITRLLGIEPTQVIRRGDSLGRRGGTADENVWRFQSRIDEREFLEPHVDWLLGQLPSTLDILRQVSSQWQAQFALAVHVYSIQAPSIALSESTIHRLAALGASLDIDLYCRREEA